MEPLSITEIMTPNFLKCTTALLMTAMQKGGTVTVKVENFKPVFVVSNVSAQPGEIGVPSIAAVWENPLLVEFHLALLDVICAGKGEVTFRAGVEKTVSYYPDRK